MSCRQPLGLPSELGPASYPNAACQSLTQRLHAGFLPGSKCMPSVVHLMHTHGQPCVPGQLGSPSIQQAHGMRPVIAARRPPEGCAAAAAQRPVQP